MANILHKNADLTVQTILDRNNIVRKIDHMVVVVLDAIADPIAGAGVATYRWNDNLNKWILISKSSVESISFETDELLISNGTVRPSNIPTDNQIWDIKILEDNAIVAEPRMEDLSVTSVSISGLSAWNGKKIRFTYAYGTISQQIDSYIDERISAMLNGVSPDGDTMKELYDLIKAQGAGSGSITDFEGGLL